MLTPSIGFCATPLTIILITRAENGKKFLKSRTLSQPPAHVSMNTKARRKRVQLILNGKVAANDALRAAVAGQRKAGHRIQVRVTWEKGDARRFVSEADKVDLLIAAGGDGTVNEVLHGLMDMPTVSRPSLAIVPLGTANDFAIACGIPRDPKKASALCMRGAEVPIDVSRANDNWVINAASYSL